MRVAWSVAVVMLALALAQAANKEFSSSVEGIASELGSSLSASDAKAQLATALDQLAASYQKAFAPLNCD